MAQDSEFENTGSEQQAQALLSLRIIWAGMVVGQVLIGAVFVGLLVMIDQPHGLAGPAPLLSHGAVALVAAPVVIAHFVRQQIFKAHWRGDAITFGGYATGTIAYLAILEGAAVIALILMLLTGQWFIAALVAVLVILQAMNYPTGKPLAPTSPRVE